MADSSPARQTQATPSQQQNQDDPPTTPATQQTPPAAAIPPLPPAAATSPGKRPRGRPLGSKNKTTPPIDVTEENPDTQHIQLLIPVGCDLIAALESFARQNQTGIHVQGGHGRVTNITFRPSGTPIPGVVDLVSLAGTFLDPYKYNGCMEGAFPSYLPGTAAPWLKMILSTGHTWVISRAYVAAGALTVTDVLVKIITFRHLEIQRLDPSMSGFQEPAYPPSPALTTALNIGGSGEASGSGLGGDAQIVRQMPPSLFGLPDGERIYVPLAGVSAFTPPNYRNALNIGGGGEASGSGLVGDAQMAGEMPRPRFRLPEGTGIHMPSAGVSAFRPPSNRNALNIGGGGEASGSGLVGDAQMASDMPPPRFRLPEGSRIYMPSVGVSAFRPPNYRSALNVGGGGEAGGSGSGGDAQIGGEMPAPGFRPPVGEQQKD